MNSASRTYWEVYESPSPSPFLDGSIDFGSTNRCYLLDPYNGRLPFLVDENLRRTGQNLLRAEPLVMLDSNLASQVQAAGNGLSVADGFRDLLAFIARERWNATLHFYYVEHLCNSGSQKLREYAVPRTTALLQLLTMDHQQFLRSGKVVPSSPAVEDRLRLCNAQTLEEASERTVDQFLARHDRPALNDLLAATEIALIRMVLLEKFECRNESATVKLEMLQVFLSETLGAQLAVELLLAAHYFHGKAGRLLGVQPNTPAKRALSIVRSTALDLYFLRQYPQFFTGSAARMRVTYLATQETSLADLGKQIVVARMYPDEHGKVFPVLGYDPSQLPEDFELPSAISQGATPGPKRIPVGLRDSLIAELTRRLSSNSPQ